LLMSTTKPYRRACTNISGAQFGSERKSHDLAANARTESNPMGPFFNSNQ
jgi:hypothetical protein